MIDLLKRVFKGWFTGKDNESFEIMRALLAVSVLTMLFCVIWHVVVNKAFDPQASCLGLGGLLLGGGAGTAMKDKSTSGTS